MKILISLKKNKGWKAKKIRDCKLWFKGYLNNENINSLIEKLIKLNFNQKKIVSYYRNLYGHY